MNRCNRSGVLTGGVIGGLRQHGRWRIWLAIIGVLTSVVSVFFCLRVIVMMYMAPPTSAAAVPSVPKVAGAALVVSALIIFYLGLLPARILDITAASIGTIF